MTTIWLPGDVPVALPDGLSQEMFLAFQPFQDWLATLRRSLELQARPSHPFSADPYTLHSVTVQSFDSFGNSGRIGFMKLQARVVNTSGETLPGCVFLRGPSVAMLILLIPDDIEKGSAAESEERHVILTVQARIPAGSLEFVELPAGMVNDRETFAGTAARELKEELGLELVRSELTCLSDLAQDQDQGQGEEGLPSAMYPSAGGCDEYMPIFMHERRIPREHLRSWAGRLTGQREEGEKITLKLVKMKDLWKAGRRDAKCLAALALWEGLKNEGKI